MNDQTANFQEIKNFAERSKDSEFLAATEKFLDELRRARTMEAKAIERFQTALKNKKPNFK